jgi:hypothetical protein
MPTSTDAAGELRSAGLSASGIEGDMDMAGDMSAPEDMEMPDEGATGAPGQTPATAMPASPVGGPSQI